MVNRRKHDDGTTETAEIGCRFTPFLIQFSFFVGPITIIKIKNKNEKKCSFTPALIQFFCGTDNKYYNKK